MKPQNEKLVSTLKALTKDRVYDGGTSSAPYEIVCWEVEGKGPFSLESFLVDNRGLISFESDDFIDRLRRSQTEEAISHYQRLLSLVQTHLSELKIYGYRLLRLPMAVRERMPVDEDIFENPGIPMFIGLSTAGEWIGLGLKQHMQPYSSPRFEIADLESVGESTAQLVEEIRAIASKIEHEMKKPKSY